MSARVAIDLNVRVRGNDTYAGLEDVEGQISLGAAVEVYEPETGVIGQGRVNEIDLRRRLVYLSVEWNSIREPEPQPEEAPAAEPATSTASRKLNALAEQISSYATAIYRLRAANAYAEAVHEAWERGMWQWTPTFADLVLTNAGGRAEVFELKENLWASSIFDVRSPGRKAHWYASDWLEVGVPRIAGKASDSYLREEEIV